MSSVYPPQPFPMFSQGQGMPGQPPTNAMGGPPPQQQRQGIDPNSIQAMLALNQQAPQMEEIARQRKLADMMRAQGKAQLQGVQAGRMYRGPTALNAAADIFSQYAGMKGDQAANAQARGLADQQEDAARQFMAGVTGKPVAPRPVAPPQNPMAGGDGGSWFKGLFGG